MVDRDLMVKIETPEDVRRIAEAAKKARIALEKLELEIDKMNSDGNI